MNVKIHSIDESANDQRLDNYLFKNLKGVPKSHIYKIIRKGQVRVNKGRKKVNYKLQINDTVRIPPIIISEKKQLYVSESLKKILFDSILYEDDGIVIINKPSGIAVHSGSGIKVGVIETLRESYKSIELVHRIDRDTSGVLLIAKKQSVLKNLHKQFKNNTIKKSYMALVDKVWAKKIHTVNVPLCQDLSYTRVSSQGKNAISHFHPLKNFNKEIEASLVEVLIETGRTHQIRAHARYVKHCLAGDDKYGDSEFNKKVKSKGLKRLFLHAHKLAFINPTSGNLQKINAPLPSELEFFLKQL